MFNVKEFRSKFPVLCNNPDLIYFDTASTSLVPKKVLDVMDYYYKCKTSNLGRGVDNIAYENTMRYESVRNLVREFIKARDDKEIIFTRGTTESINIISQYFIKEKLNPGDEILLNIAEHHSNLLPWIKISKDTGAIIKYVDINTDGTINTQSLEKTISNTTKVVSFAHVNNIMGSTNDVAAIARIIRNYNYDAIIVVDGAQAVIDNNIDVSGFDCDFYTFSSHKMYGPTGVGVLYGKYKHLETMEPFCLGGGAVEQVNKFDYTLKPVPYRFEAGTMMIAEVFGLGAAIEFIKNYDKNSIHTYLYNLRKYYIEKLKTVHNIIIYNEANYSSKTIVFSIRDIHAHDLATRLTENNICIRTGDHCAQLMNNFLKVSSTVRISFAPYNIEEEINKTIEVLKKAEDFLDVFF